MPRLAELQAEASSRLAKAGVEAPARDARLLLGEVLGLDTPALLAEGEREISPPDVQAFEALLQRRIAREPVSRILGRREFWSLEFQLSTATLDPRPESETLIEALLERLPDRARNYRVLDLGTGTGCLLLALLSELPQASGLGIDLVPEAVDTAQRNAERLGFKARAEFRVGDWGAGVEENFDILLCNPPYIAESEWRALAPEVADHDPRAALLAGDGLAAYRRLGPEAARLLAPGGLAAFEIGAGQAESAATVLGESELKLLETRSDLAALPRCLLFGKARLV